jgi:guanosine-3',5'-bis(diphosphate) 3'-pyrophosphohydrolase
MQEEILEQVNLFAAEAHAGQLRKFTGEIYIRHPERVMEICREYSEKLPVLSAALLHDVLEDTAVTPDQMQDFLKDIMSPEEAEKTLRLVIDLTDVFIKNDYPHLNRKARKQKEAERMEKIHPDAQTVKYADIIDNAIDITENDTGFAGKFLGEVKLLLEKLDKGNAELYSRAQQTVSDCIVRLRKKNVSG